MGAAITSIGYLSIIVFVQRHTMKQMNISVLVVDFWSLHSVYMCQPDKPQKAKIGQIQKRYALDLVSLCLYSASLSQLGS